MGQPLVCDLEFVDGRLICNGWSWGTGPVTVDEVITPEFAEWMADPSIVKVGHSKTDWRQLEEWGFAVAGPLHDTMVMAWVLNENTPLALEWVAKRYSGITMDKRIKSVKREPYFRTDSGEWVHLRDAPVDQVIKYNREDVEATALVYDELMAKMDATSWDIYFEEEQVDFTNVLLRMELNGIPINLEDAAKLREKLVPQLAEQAEVLDKVLGYPLRKKDGGPGYGSGNLLRSVLFEKVWYETQSIPHGLDVNKPTLLARIAERDSIPKSKVQQDALDLEKKWLIDSVTPPGFTVKKVTPRNLVGYWTRKGYGLPPTPPADPEAENPKPSTAMPVLLTTFPDNEFVQELQQWSKLRKVITTYLDAYPKFTRVHEDGKTYLHGNFNQTGTKTGRISSARPNLMNQPAHGPLGHDIRSLFQGRLIVGDYSQLEPRLTAEFSQDPVLLQAYEDEIDIYALTAAGIFGGSYRDYPEDHKQRKLAKVIYLGDQYGAGYKKLTMLARLNGFDIKPDETKQFQSRLHATYAVRAAWKEDIIRGAHARGYVETLDGHRRRLAVALRDRSWKNRGYGERQAVNAVVQGSAGDVVRKCMVAAYQEFPQLDMLAQVHDEVLWSPKPHLTQAQVEDLLPQLQEVMEQGHGFKLGVPLKFEPTIANSWADKGVTDLEWPDAAEEDEDA